MGRLIRRLIKYGPIIYPIVVKIVRNRKSRCTPREIEPGCERLSRRPRCATRSPSPRPASALYHERQRPADQRFTDEAGVELGWRWTALESVGIYVPGRPGRLSVDRADERVPAAVAGVERIAMVTPPGRLQPAVLAAAQRPASPRSGGSAARRRWPRWPMAPGRSGRWTRSSAPATPTSPPPSAGVYGVVGIDALAGPSEIVVVADAHERSGLDRRRPAVPGRARPGRPVDPDHRRRGLRRSGRGGASSAQLQTLATGEAAAAVLARPRRGGDRAARRRAGPGRPHRARARGVRRRRSRAAGRPRAPRRRDLPRPPCARGDRRLCGRLQPRAAHQPRGALLVGPVDLRLPQAHLDREVRRRRLRARWPPADRWRWPRPRACRRMPAPPRSGCNLQAGMAAAMTGEPSQAASTVVARRGLARRPPRAIRSRSARSPSSTCSRSNNFHPEGGRGRALST